MPSLIIRPSRDAADTAACARLMAQSEPWLTLGRDYPASYRSIGDPAKEVFLAEAGDQMVGFLALDMRGILAGYIQSICVAAHWRGQGIGSLLMNHAEERIFRDSPNAFLFVSSFNHTARHFYEQRGYTPVGDIPDLLVAGYHETLLRKTHGALASYPANAATDVEWRDGDYLISTNPARLDIDAIHTYLTRSYWAAGRSRAVVARSLRHSLCFGLYHHDAQVGLARIVTDYATFAWLCDVYVLEEHRGAGMGKQLIAAVVAHPDLSRLKRIMLATRDAHGLYRQYGFEPLTAPERWMVHSAADASP